MIGDKGGKLDEFRAKDIRKFLVWLGSALPEHTSHSDRLGISRELLDSVKDSIEMFGKSLGVGSRSRGELIRLL